MSALRLRPISVFALLFALATPGDGQSNRDEGLLLTAYVLPLSATVGGPTTQFITIGVQVTTARCSEFRLVANEPSWIAFQNRGGTAPGGIAFTVDFSGFSPNETRYFAATLESTNPDCLVVLPERHGVVIFRKRFEIIATLYPAGPRPAPFPTPQILEFTDATGAQQTISRALQVANVGDGSASYGFEVAYQGEHQGWLAVQPPVGTVGQTPQQHQVHAQTASLPAGTHRAILTLRHDSPAAPPYGIPVTLTLAGPPRLSASPTKIEGKARRGKQDPPPVTLKVTNTGGGTIQYQIASDAAWVKVSPAQGQTVGATAVEHLIAIEAKGLSVGKHTAELSILASGPTATGSPAKIPVEVTVEPGGTIRAAPAEVSAEAAPGSPERRTIRLELASPELDRLRWRARPDPPDVRWLHLAEREGSLPSVLTAEVDGSLFVRPVAVGAAIVVEAFDPADLAAATEEGGPEPSAALITLRVPVELRVRTQAPVLTVAPARVELIARPGEGPRRQPLAVSAGGGAPVIAWEAGVEERHGAGWLTVTPGSGGGPGIAEILANPAGLAPGVYDGAVTIRAGAARQVVPVAFLVAAPGQAVLAAAPRALTLRGSANALGTQAIVANLGDGPAPNWTASAASAGGWLAARPGDGGRLRVEAAGAGAVAGRRAGAVEIAAAGAPNGPHSIAVYHERRGPGAAPEPVFEAGGQIFVVTAGAAAPVARAVAVSTDSDTAARVLLGVATERGGDWLRVTPADGQASAASPLAATVSADAAGLGPGLYRGRVSASIPGGPMRSIPVALAVRPPGGCQPSEIFLAPIRPADGASAVAGLPVGVEARVVDNCGMAVRSAGVAIEGGGFLRDFGPAAEASGGGEIFVGDAVAPDAGSFALRLHASAGPLGRSEYVVSLGAVASQGGETPRSASPPVHAATFELGRPLAPGGIATIFGARLATGRHDASTLPLPTEMGQFSVTLGGRPAPLFFLNESQANLQVPAEIPANTLLQSVVRAGGEVLPPETFLSAPAAPGAFPLDASIGGPGFAVSLNQDYSLNAPANPAPRGSVVTVFLTGIGATVPLPASGAPAPAAEPFSRAAAPYSATLDDLPADVLYLGLSPGFVGLAQANVRIPMAAPVGPGTALRIRVGDRTGSPARIAVGP